MHTALPRHDVVLLGIGHTNAHVLRLWRMQPIPDARLTCVSDFHVATYSGMLPGTLAGQYPPDRMQIDLVRLCAAAGARLIVGEVTGLDADNRRLTFADRPPVPFDVLSVGVGSVPRTDGVDFTDTGLALPIKPMQTFLSRLDARLRLLVAARPGPLRVAVVGGGAGGVEIAFCLPRHVARLCAGVPLDLTLIDAGGRLVPGAAEATARRVAEEFRARGVDVRLGRAVVRVGDGGVELAGGERVAADLVLWATGAAAPPLLGGLGLPTDGRGFLLTRPTLQTTADLPVFAVGDAGTMADAPVPKAGVYAVREGPVLWGNIRRVLEKKPLKVYRPQRGFLKLLNTGDGKAFAEYAGLTFRGRWCWRLKDYIDGKFMRMYHDYRPMPMKAPPAPDGPVMRCAGCGGKVGGSVLSAALARLSIPPADGVLVGLDRPDDAAVLQLPPGRPVTVTVDFFAAPLDDPYLVGRVAALNSLSDVFAMGAAPVAALAMATLPLGRPRQQEQTLYELLAGSLEEFGKCGTALVGGHTIEGPQLTVGYTVIADQQAPPRRKGDLKPGDLLVLTKPLGSGVLLAAHMQALCRAAWFPPLQAALLQSNAPAAAVAAEFDLCAVTDVTGFGLAGHLLEMLGAAGVAARLELDNVPLLPGVEELITAHGVESTLAPANKAAEAEIVAPAGLQSSARYAALFDPQTSGGLLLGVPEGKVDAVLARLRGLSDIPVSVIGRAGPLRDGRRRLEVV